MFDVSMHWDKFWTCHLKQYRRTEMKHLLTGNGINIQFDRHNYTTQQIVLRILKNCDRDDFPSHIIVNFPYLLKNYIGQLFLEARCIIKGDYDKYVNCYAEKASLNSFKEQYGSKIETLKITDIGFEDYYLIHDLVCHKTNTTNPEQFYVREALRIAYLFSINNDGKLNSLHNLYPVKFLTYLNDFNTIFTTNYDLNIDLSVKKEIFHIHGQFDRLAAVYDINSFRNQLPDSPVKDINIDPAFSYLYSNALSTHCGEYKEFQLKQYSFANSAVEKLAVAYLCNSSVKSDVDSWTEVENTLTSNMGYAVQLKVKHPELNFSDDYHLDRLINISGEVEVLGLSPWNDFHIFESLNNANVELCTFYYFSEDQCEKIKELLPTLTAKGLLQFSSVKEFWGRMYEK
jgi:hypothetical protein